MRLKKPPKQLQKQHENEKKSIQRIKRKFQINQHVLALYITNSLDNYIPHAISLMNQIIISQALR